MWLETQRNLLTASNFGQVCKMKLTTGCQSLVKQLRYSSFDCEVIAYGRHHEGYARLQVGSAVGLSIELCGLLIDKEKYFLGGTSYALVASTGLIECPSSAKYMSPDEAILARKVTSWTKKKMVRLAASTKIKTAISDFG